MIYKSVVEQTMNDAAEREADSLLEGVEDRFEYNTIAEATMIIVEEQEINWNRFMQGVGISELTSVMEGTQFIYEGARLDSLMAKAKGYFEKVLQKLKEITASFMKKVDELSINASNFLKKYENKIKSAKLPADFKIKGYEFGDLSTAPTYDTSELDKAVNADMQKVIDNKDQYTREKAEKDILGGNIEGSLVESLTVKYYGSKSKVEINNFNLDKQLHIIKHTKDMKKEARNSFAKAYQSVNKIIKNLDKMKKANKDKESSMDQAINVLLTFSKAYSSAISTKHGVYMRALAARRNQAMYVCTRALGTAMADERAAKKEAKKKSKETKATNEGFVNTEAFLGAIDYI